MTTEPEDDEARILAMLLQFRDSLTEMSLLLKDYRANLDVMRQGSATKTSSLYVESVRRNAVTVHERKAAMPTTDNEPNHN